jgi:hypothetical protein
LDIGTAMFAGATTGAATYLLLARFSCALAGGKRAGGWLFAALLLPLAGLLGCAAAAARLLVWYGCAAGLFLSLLAVGRMVLHMLKERR